MTNRLILASRSPRRQELLAQMGLDFDVFPSEIEETPLPGESPREHVLRLAAGKALDVGNRFPDRWVIGADTIVCVNGTILGKPKTKEDASGMLRLLSGREHRVLTGFSIIHREKGRESRDVAETLVKAKLLAPEEIAWYIGTGEPFDKAGAYAIQGAGSFLVEWIHGSYTNVVGLPLCEVVEMLKRLGALTITECGLRIAK